MGIQVPENDYYSLHGMWGSYASLILGRVGQGAGVVIGNVQAPQRSLFIGYRKGNELPHVLPFTVNKQVGLSANSYVDPDAPARPADLSSDYKVFDKKEIERSVTYSGEVWEAGKMSLTVTSFFGVIPNPATTDTLSLRLHMKPALYVRLKFDNSDSTDAMIGFFGMQGIRRPLSDSTQGSLLGFAHGTEWGFACLPAEGIEEVMDWSVMDALLDANRPLRRLASEGALRFNVDPGQTKEYLVAIGVYRDGVVTSGKKAHMYYTSLFKDLEDVLEYALEDAPSSLTLAEALDAELDAAELSHDRKFLLAHAVHSYCANTELLLTEEGDPLFIVNEGEYQMMNTLDLTIDQAFFELQFSPWTVRNELIHFLERSSYTDRYGIAFAHDQGVADCFTPTGTSSYELPALTGCFSYMSYEETVNWVITACLYLSASQDREWFTQYSDALQRCAKSLQERDQNKDGIMDVDSDRCSGGAEITTYDSLDISLGQARNNLYLAVKAWAAFVCIDHIFSTYEGQNSSIAHLARAAALAAAQTIQNRMLPEGYIPAVFESDNRSKIIPAIEGLAYPYLCGKRDAVSLQGPYGTFIQALKTHLRTVLVPGSCLDAVSGGWKLSSTSYNTWLSKIFLNQFVAEEILGIKDERTQRDHVHARWLRTGSAQWAATDQVHSNDGHDMGSRLYPRLVTSILWLTKAL
ncbi:MAG: glycoside hydrolase family 52 protein [Termitinemataceae bacterium]